MTQNTCSQGAAEMAEQWRVHNSPRSQQHIKDMWCIRPALISGCQYADLPDGSHANYHLDAEATAFFGEALFARNLP